MEKNPRLRYQSASDLLSDLRRSSRRLIEAFRLDAAAEAVGDNAGGCCGSPANHHGFSLENVVFDTTALRRYNKPVQRIIQFDWDQWNIQKNESKHGVSRLEAESTFFDTAYKLFEDRRHSTLRESRYILYGRSIENRVLMVGFTLRSTRIRVITARPASRKEREIYESS